MKIRKGNVKLFPLIILSSLWVGFGCGNETQPSGPQIFEPGKISTESVEYGPTFSKTGSVLYFSRSDDKWGTRDLKSAIFYSKMDHNKWSTPKVVSFSGQYDDSDPHLTDNGRTIYFVSNRPSKESEQASNDIWKVEKDKNNKWGVPVSMSQTVNSEKSEYSPCTDRDGNLFFASTRLGGYGQGDLYMAKKQKDTFGLPKNLGQTINTENGEWNLEISGDGGIMIFESSGREQGLSSYGDLYISFKRENEWSVPQAIQEINTTGSDLSAELYEPDKLLYFASSDSLSSTVANIYAIDFGKIYDRYRGNAVFLKE